VGIDIAHYVADIRYSISDIEFFNPLLDQSDVGLKFIIGYLT
jgi:hypothetical protein